MPSGKTKFNVTWLSTFDSNNQKMGDWCRKGKDDSHGHCTLCQIDIKCDNSGKAQLLQHARKKKHMELLKNVLDTKQTKLSLMNTSASATSIPSDAISSAVVCSNTDKSTVSMMTLKDSSDSNLNATVYWLAEVACKNLSLRSCDNKGSLFKAMFPDSAVAAQFSLSRTSASYIIGDGLSPYFTGVIVSDLVKSNLPFSIHFDETSTTQVKKQMDLTIRYWSPQHNQVWCSFYTSLFFGHADGNTVAFRMYQKMCDDKLPIQRLATLVRDGPNVNKTIFRNLNELISRDHPDFPGLIDLDSCAIHTIHNGFRKGIKEFDIDISQFCYDLHSIFKYSAARREDFRSIQLEFDLETHNFKQHTEVRWLSIGPSVKRVIEQWEAIVHFVSDLGKSTQSMPKSANFKRVQVMLSTKEKFLTRVFLEFFANITPIFENLLRLLQKNSPMIHILYDQLCEFILKLLRRFMIPEAIGNKYGIELRSIDCRSESSQLSNDEIMIGDSTRKAMSNLKPEQRTYAFHQIRLFFGSASSYLIEKLPLGNSLLSQLRCVNPLKKKDEVSTVFIQEISKALQPEVDVNELLDEWKLYQSDNNVPIYDPSDRIEMFWNGIFQLKAADGNLKYRVLPIVIKSALVLGQTNADSERSLSINSRIVTQERTSLGEKTIVGLHVVKDAVRFFDPDFCRPEAIPISQELKRAVRYAHAAYKENQEREKAEHQRKKDENEKSAELPASVQREKEQLLRKKIAVTEKEKGLHQEENKAREELKAADELMKDATAKLNSAVDGKKSIETFSMKVVTMMFETANQKREAAMKQLDEITNKKRKNEKKKRKLLDKALSSNKIMILEDQDDQ